MAQRVILFVILALGLAGLAWAYLPWETRATPEELAELALTAQSEEERAKAAAKLSDYGPESLEFLRHVAQETTDPPVQAICLQGLARLWDYESMDLLLDMAESGSPLVRGQAAQAVMRMTGRTRPYAASASVAQRETLVGHMREDWQQIQNATPEDREELKRRLRESHE